MPLYWIYNAVRDFHQKHQNLLKKNSSLRFQLLLAGEHKLDFCLEVTRFTEISKKVTHRKMFNLVLNERRKAKLAEVIFCLQVF